MVVCLLLYLSGALSAGALIDASGLKGTSVGGAAVSEKHANFLVNADNASAAVRLAQQLTAG